MENYLVITALGEDRPGIVGQLSEAVLDSGCNIIDSRMTVLGGEFAVILMAGGKWNELAKLEDTLPGLGKRLDLTLINKRTTDNNPATDLMPYTVEVITLDQPGIVYRLSSFFASRNINIQELNTIRYAAAHTGTSMFALSLTANVPASIHVATLRDEFLDFCEAQNMDATLEPSKP
ncbi:MAG TPA: glycine cleavage system protein R [Gammaproteobacteria bacterium]|nr:glycine cleavage system protein R [Gammaproteobacteria bacterium]